MAADAVKLARLQTRQGKGAFSGTGSAARALAIGLSALDVGDERAPLGGRVQVNRAMAAVLSVPHTDYAVVTDDFYAVSGRRVRRLPPGPVTTIHTAHS